MLPNSLADDFTDGKAGTQAGEGILEDNLHLRPHGPHLLGAEVIDLFTVKEYLAAGLFAGQTEDGTAGGGLAAAGFAHQAHGGAAL